MRSRVFSLNFPWPSEMTQLSPTNHVPVPKATPVTQAEQPNAGVLVDALHFDRSRSSIDELARVPAHRLHYWQICDGPAERPASFM